MREAALSRMNLSSIDPGCRSTAEKSEEQTSMSQNEKKSRRTKSFESGSKLRAPLRLSSPRELSLQHLPWEEGARPIYLDDESKGI